MAESGAARSTQGTGPQTRPPTMRDVAAAAGVSKALVSMIFRNAPGPSAQSRSHVLAVAERIGYRPNRTASMLARRRNKQLGVMMTLRDSFQAELAEEMQAAADTAGYEIVLGAVTRSHGERRAVETLLEFRCEALLLIHPQADTEELAALAAQVPVVVVGRRVQHPDVAVVRGDDLVGMRTLVEHLVELGHRNIVHVDGGDADGGAAPHDRRQGYLTAMREHGLDEYIRTMPGGPTEFDGAAAAETLLAEDHDLPTAIVAYNDRSAVGILDRLTRAGVDVPGRVSLTGFGDSPIVQSPRARLTTVRQDARRQARLAVEAAIGRLEGRISRPHETVLTPRLQIRTSTAPPRHAAAARNAS